MKRRIVLISRSGLAGWSQNTMLRREDFDLFSTDSYESAFRALVRERCDLFVAEHWPGGVELPFFIGRVRSSMNVSGLKGIAISG